MITTKSVRRRQAKQDAKAARRHPLKPAPIYSHRHVLVPLTAERIGDNTPDLLVGWSCVTCPELFTPRYTPSKLWPSEGDLETGTQARRRRRTEARRLAAGRYGDRFGVHCGRVTFSVRVPELKKEEPTPGDGAATTKKRSQIHLRRVHTKAELWKNNGVVDHLIAAGRIEVA